MDRWTSLAAFVIGACALGCRSSTTTVSATIASLDAAPAPSSSMNPTAIGGGPRTECPRGHGPLSETARKAIERALADERQAEARYASIGEEFGAALVRIRARDQRRHSARLESLLVGHLSPLPPAAMPIDYSYTTSTEACDAALSLERRNVATYDEELARELPEDVRCVMEGLRHDSLAEDVPPLERCASNAK